MTNWPDYVANFYRQSPEDQRRLWAQLTPDQQSAFNAARAQVDTAPPAPVPDSPGSRRVLIACVSVLAIGLLLGLGFVVVGAVNAPKGQRLSPSSASTRTPRIGDDCHLVVSPGEVVVSVSEPAYDEFKRLASANDTLGIANMVMEGRAFLVQSGTRAKKIDNGFTWSEVRILEGPMIGRSGRVPSSLCKP